LEGYQYEYLHWLSAFSVKDKNRYLKLQKSAKKLSAAMPVLLPVAVKTTGYPAASCGGQSNDYQLEAKMKLQAKQGN
jgi:hypothetical protein